MIAQNYKKFPSTHQAWRIVHLYCSDNTISLMLWLLCCYFCCCCCVHSGSFIMPQDPDPIPPFEEDDVSRLKRAISKGDIGTVEMLLDGGKYPLRSYHTTRSYLWSVFICFFTQSLETVLTFHTWCATNNILESSCQNASLGSRNEFFCSRNMGKQV